jgi:hypothetical protein
VRLEQKLNRKFKPDHAVLDSGAAHSACAAMGSSLWSPLLAHARVVASALGYWVLILSLFFAPLAATTRSPLGVSINQVQAEPAQPDAENDPKKSSIPAQLLRDPEAQPDPKNLVDVAVRSQHGSADELREESPRRVFERIRDWKHAGYQGAVHFTNQYATFSIATGAMMLYEMGTKGSNIDPTDPVALQNWENQTFNAMGAAGFAVFMAANHPVVQMYHSLKGLARENKLAHSTLQSLFGYLGMAAGSWAQNMFTEVWSDKDVWDCLRPYHNSSATIVPQACEKMRNTWINSGKILKYWPSVVAMMGSAGISTMVREGISWSGGKLVASKPISGAKAKFLAAGFDLVHKSRLAELTSALVTKVPGGRAAAQTLAMAPGAVAGVGDFVLFFAINADFTEDFVNSQMQDFRMNYVDPNAWMAKNLHYHTDFIWPTVGTYQPIQNAFDVEATNTYNAHNYLMDFYRLMQTSGWKKPGAVSDCAPISVQEALARAKSQPAPTKATLLPTKSNQQLSCEVLRQPDKLIERYGELNREWRGILLDPYTRSVNNWVEMIDQFYTVYDGTKRLATHLTDAKHALVYQQSGQVPDLSREALAKVLRNKGNATDSQNSDNENEDGPRKHNAFLDNTWVPTPELVDFIVAGFACGPDATLDTAAMKKGYFARFFDDVYSYFAHRLSSESYLTTPWGSSINFVPPKLTNKSRAICDNVSRDMYSTVNYMLGNPFPNLTKNPVKNPFTGPFYDEDRKSYRSMAEFVFNNMDPEVYRLRGGGNNFDIWWDDRFTTPVKAVWENYVNVYDQFINKKYMPALFDRTYRGGCRAGQDISAPGDASCGSSSAAYRVANGYFLSLEIELRNYLRGLFSLYESTLNSGDAITNDREKEKFKSLANALVSSIQNQTPESLRAPTFDASLAQSKQVLEQINSLLVQRLQTPSEDNKYRLSLANKLKEQIERLLTEQSQQVMIVKQLNLFGSNSGAPVQKIDNLPSASSVKRR